MLTFADHCPSNANKSRRIIWPHKDGQTKVSKLKTDIFIRRSKGELPKGRFQQNNPMKITNHHIKNQNGIGG